MRRITWAALAAAVALGGLTPGVSAQVAAGVPNQETIAPAQPRVGARQQMLRRIAQWRWRKLDADGNGVISRDEWTRDPAQFDRVDADKDGNITPTEARAAVAARVRARAAARWKQIDTDGNGAISREEWQRRPDRFERLDANHDGQLTPDELRAALGARRR